MNTQPNNTLGWPEHVTVPAGLEIKFVDMENPFMQKAFLHMVAHAEKQKTLGIRPVTSVIKANDGALIYGVVGELEDEDDVTWHEKEGRCARYQAGSATANSDYDSCPGCRHDRHSERAATRKALRDKADIVGAELYMYGQWWACEPCMTAVRDAGIATLYVLADSRPLFDRAVEGQKENRKNFEEKWGNMLAA
jgi:tRNA(Arg) A34 adenosine deaminase TadA